MSMGPPVNGIMRPRVRVEAEAGYTGYGVPPFRDGFVSRPALVRRLLDEREAALALIVAPAGYGKTTLLAEWAACDQRPFIWLTLRPDDQAPIALAQTIAEAFEDAGWIEPDLWPALAPTRGSRYRSALNGLLRSADLRSRSFVLVLDDAHNGHPSALKETVAALLQNLGPGAQIALATRTEPPIPIGRLRAHRTLVELRTDDLAMAPAEAATLLRQAGLELDFGAVQTLSGQTEGWPVGLYLAALALRHEDDVDAGLKRFGGSDHLIAEYFRDELLANLTPELTRFVSRSSVLDELSGPVCDAVLDEEGSADTLSTLAGRNLMLTAVDHSHQRFRWHGLFRGMLRAELQRTEPGLESRLHSRASTWHRRHGDLDGAIEHAVAAGNVARTGDLLWASLAGYLGNGRHELVADWLDRFSDDQIGRYAPLALTASYSCLFAGKLDQARHWRLLSAESKQRGRPAKDVPSLQAGMAIIDAVGAASALDMAQHAARAYQLEPSHGPWRGMSCFLLGVAEHLAGNRERAVDLLQEGAQAGSPGGPLITSLCLAQLAIIAIERKQWESATELADRAATIVDRPLLAGTGMSALTFAAAAAARARQGRVDEAKRNLRRGADLLVSLGDFIPWYGAEARIMLARAALGLADTVGARTLLAEASRLARRTSDVVIFQHFFDEAWAQIDTLAETALSGPSSLTIAELRVLRFLPSHRSFREIAERLDVSVNTVKTQAHAIYRKLDAASRSEAVARARSAGLLGV
jgi:LuxR family transcriptional regulator, maltose regulon positive regulatory protein